jgi:hypothetical protein
VTHEENQGLIVTDGTRIIIDRLDLSGFAVSSIAVYGSDEPTSIANANAGEIGFEILFGSFNDSPIYFVPAIVMVGMGGLVIGLLIFKKRRPSN